VAAGDTEEETRQNFREALIAHLSLMVEIGASIPEPHFSSIPLLSGIGNQP